jgi:hypothetical protein
VAWWEIDFCQTMGGPLLLDTAAAEGAPVLGRWALESSVDALPYVDDLPEGWKQAAEQMVKEEARAPLRRLLTATCM